MGRQRRRLRLRLRLRRRRQRQQRRRRGLLSLYKVANSRKVALSLRHFEFPTGYSHEWADVLVPGYQRVRGHRCHGQAEMSPLKIFEERVSSTPPSHIALKQLRTSSHRIVSWVHRASSAHAFIVYSFIATSLSYDIIFATSNIFPSSSSSDCTSSLLGWNNVVSKNKPTVLHAD